MVILRLVDQRVLGRYITGLVSLHVVYDYLPRCKNQGEVQAGSPVFTLRIYETIDVFAGQMIYSDLDYEWKTDKSRLLIITQSSNGLCRPTKTINTGVIANTLL